MYFENFLKRLKKEDNDMKKDFEKNGIWAEKKNLELVKT